ncbi:MAG TPA: YggS family pyridoxal phosphate-dependent enzyme [Clostridia bacterium]|nr:YggS family pyridoxal phosphate-dependent enzyme [Clostridia bacterium]
MSIAENIAAIRTRIASAAARVGRDPEAVSLMAVSKTHPAESIRQAYEAGQRLFGENRVQEFFGKHDALGDLARARFHLIGHLQSNKATRAVELFSGIDSVDSLKLAERLNAAGAQAGKTVAVLIEMNVGGEQAKSGIPLDSPELGAILTAAPRLTNLDICGLMTVPPFTQDSEGARPFFRALRDLRHRIAAYDLPRVSMTELSMGMSHDFEVAVEEGSTCVRIGTAIFGARDHSA